MDSKIGEVINSKYKLIRLLGDGGMGAVYEAQHEVLGTRVAIKVLHPELARRTGLVDRFLQEARVAALIKSAHVVQVTDVDRTADGLAFIVMELLDGEPLSAILDRQHRIAVSTATEYTTQILEALEAAHALGVTHRDLKPENVFVTYVGGKPVLKLIDFGIAKIRRDEPAFRNLTIAGVLMGTAEYMAPEQARSATEADARSDIYAVGVMLFEMLAGTRPVLGDDARIIALKVERGEVTPLVQAAPDTPRELAGLVHRAMAARPELRFASATEMRLALAAAMSGRRAGTGPMPAVAGAAAALLAPGPGAAAARSAGTAAAAKALEDSGTGTLKGAPVEAVMAAAASREGARHVGSRVETSAQGAGRAAVAYAGTPPPGAGGPHTDGDAAPNTMRAPHQGPAMVPPAPHYDHAAQRRGRARGGLGGKLWILAIPVVVGGAILVAVAASGSRRSSQPWSPGGTATATTPTGAPPTSPGAGAATGTDTALQPLDPGTPRPPTRPTGGGAGGVPSSVPSAVPSASAAQDGSAPSIPSSIPTGITIPDGGFTIPSSLPSGFPTTLPPMPSTFPFPFPTGAPPASQPPAPTQHPPAGGPGF